MILLTSTSDLVQVVTTSTANLDVHASYVDFASGSATPDNQNTLISTATTTTIVSSPGASTVRSVKTIAMRNRHASTTQEVTVLHSDGTNVPELIKATLLAGWALHYDEGGGWTVKDGQGRTVERLDGVTPAASTGLGTTVLGADVTNAEAVANTITNVTGLSFPVVSGNTYYFRFSIFFTTAANATGSLWTINGPATSLLVYRSEYTISATSRTFNEGITAYDTPATSNGTSIAAGSQAIVEGFITPSADGTVIARFASEVGASAVVAKAGSIVQYVQVL